MDSIQAIITIIADAALVATKDVTAQAVKDVYSSLKTFCSQKFTDVSFQTLEKNPGNENRQQILAEELREAQADKDDELLNHVAKLERELSAHVASAPSDNPLIDLKRFKAASFVITEAVRHRQILRATDTTVEGEFRIEFSSPEDEKKK